MQYDLITFLFGFLREEIVKMLSQRQLEDVCLAWDQSAKTCRYLRQDDVDSQKWCCLKHRAKQKKKIDDKMQEMLQENRAW